MGDGTIPITAATYERAINSLAGEVAALRARLAVAEALLAEHAAETVADSDG